MKEEAIDCLRCRPGDVARVVRSPNDALVGRIVEVVQLHCDGRWECELVGAPVMGLADDGDGLILTRDWLFPDCSLEPRLGYKQAMLPTLAESLAS
ncbi:hypothetical protein WI36_20115 [Burkholderia ubonensis]|nr:hypothetical protein WI36_20115 [Burkholderia ubonensis]